MSASIANSFESTTEVPCKKSIHADSRVEDSKGRGYGERLSLRTLFTANHGTMSLTYGLFIVENLLRLAQPFVIGWAINDLLNQSFVGLMVFVGQHLAHLLISTFRRMYDTRAFTEIYTDLATRLVMRQRSDDVDVSRVSARSQLSQGFVNFFEHHVPTMIRATFSISGALVMLVFYDWTLIFFCLMLLLPAFLLNAAYGRQSFAFNGGLNDRLEKEVDVIDRSNSEELRQHFDSLARWRIRLSDAEAINFGLMELFILAVLCASLVHYVGGGGLGEAAPQAGDIFAVFRYVLMFIMGLDAVPKIVAQISRLRDVGLRVR